MQASERLKDALDQFPSTREVTFGVRVSPAKLTAYRSFAAMHGLTLSEMVRRVLDVAMEETENESV